MNLILQPAGNSGAREHYVNTIQKPVSLDLISQHVAPDVVAELRRLHGDSPIAMWGVTAGGRDTNAGKWQRITPGDVALFLRDGRAASSGVVSLKLRSAPLARALWGVDNEGNTWEYLYFLKDNLPRNLTYRELNELLGYEPTNNFQGFTVVGSDRNAAALEALGVPKSAAAAPDVWWVNQRQMYVLERDRSMVWAPQRTKNGRERGSYVNVKRLKAGDLLIHYANGIRAVGSVTVAGHDADLPQGYPSQQWNQAGFSAGVRYRELDTPMPLSEIPASWRVEESERTDQGLGGSPFTKDGAVAIQYVQRLSPEFVRRIAERFPAQFPELRGSATRARSRSEPMNEVAIINGLPNRASRDFLAAGLVFQSDEITRFAAALLTKRFVILSGLSGSGKTKLAQAFASWLGASDGDNLSLVAVGPDWTSKESALGYANALDGETYSTTPTLALLLHAISEENDPHFLILDEMNLSHVERYFADFLSSMESEAPLVLHSSSVPLSGVPSSVRLPPNLFVIGTINVDETTYLFSPKVLDRANVLEFRVTSDRLARFLDSPSKPNLAAFSGAGRDLSGSFLALAKSHEDLQAPDLPVVQAEIRLFFEVLQEFGFEFGYRSAFEMTRFIAFHRLLTAGDWNVTHAIDAQILQKLLPKLHGSQRALEPALRALAVLCFQSRNWSLAQGANDAERGRLAAIARDAAASRSDVPETNLEVQIDGATYPLAFEKVRRMMRNLRRNGFTSFAEA